MLASIPKPLACTVLAVGFYITGFTICVTTKNPWYGFFFLGVLRFVIESFRP